MSCGSASSPRSTSSDDPAAGPARIRLTAGSRPLRDTAEFLHLPAVAFTSVAAYAFVRVLDDAPDAGREVAFVAAVVLTQVSIAVHNNWSDRDADALVKPWRWIPRGVVAPRTALALATLLLAAGVAVAFAIGPLVGALVLGGTAMGLAYNAWLKATAWSWVPFWIALPTLAICALAVAERLDGFPYALYAIGLPLVVAIHLADAVPDIAADRRAGLRGLAVALGPRRALLACWAGALGAIVVAALLWPAPSSPGLGSASAGVLLALGVATCTRSLHAHRYFIFASAVALAVDWLAALAS